MKDLVSHQLVKYLEDRGLKHIFGLCGHTNIAFLSALENSSIEFINVRHEQIAAHAADVAASRAAAAAVTAASVPGSLELACTENHLSITSGSWCHRASKSASTPIRSGQSQ